MPGMVRGVPGEEPRGTGCPRRGALRLEVLDLFEEPADLRGPEPAVSAEGPHGGNLSGPGPTRDGLGVHPEHHGHFGRGEQFVLSHLSLHCDENAVRSLALLIGWSSLDLDENFGRPVRVRGPGLRLLPKGEV